MEKNDIPNELETEGEEIITFPEERESCVETKENHDEGIISEKCSGDGNDETADKGCGEDLCDDTPCGVSKNVSDDDSNAISDDFSGENAPTVKDETCEDGEVQTDEDADKEPPFVVNPGEKPPYQERCYLKYHGGTRCSPLDLEGTKNFLNANGFDGGELRRAREGKDRAEDFRDIDKDKNNKMYCSYCGTEIFGVDYYRLPDGRTRCTSCSKTIIKSKAEIEEQCNRVIVNLENFFGASIDVPVTIEVLDERRLKRKIGASLGTKDDQSILILGVSVNKNKKYSILLENGAPRISLIATFAHELTHIWQYTHWDNVKSFKKCPKKMRLIIYEGMAKWVEIQYLYLIGETKVAKREELITENRKDEYGIGFILYRDKYPLSREAMSCEDTPFTPDGYPLE